MRKISNIFQADNDDNFYPQFRYRCLMTNEDAIERDIKIQEHLEYVKQNFDKGTYVLHYSYGYETLILMFKEKQSADLFMLQYGLDYRRVDLVSENFCASDREH